MFINEGEETKLNENIRYISRQASALNYQRLCTIAVYKLASAINYQCYPFLELYHIQSLFGTSYEETSFSCKCHEFFIEKGVTARGKKRMEYEVSSNIMT